MSDPRSLLEQESRRYIQTDGAFERLVRRRDRKHRNQRIEAGVLGLVVAIAVGWLGVNAIRSTPPVPADPPSEETVAPSPTVRASGDRILYFRSGRRGRGVELAVYADGRVIWEPSDPQGYVQTRLTSDGVRWLREKVESTGLFEHDLPLRLDPGWGDMEVHLGDRSVSVGSSQTRYVEATPEQADELTELEAFLHDPAAWALPSEMYVQAEASPYVPTHLWVSWDRNFPDPSQLPSPAREVLTSNLEAVLGGRCELITIDQAREIAQAMDPLVRISTATNWTGPETDDVTLGIAFTMPGEGGSPSFFHAHPALPDSACP